MNPFICVIICFFIGFLLYMLIRSYCGCKVVEGSTPMCKPNAGEKCPDGSPCPDCGKDTCPCSTSPTPAYKYFYGYFGREEKEDKGNYPGIDGPPYYILNNVNFADLKGELSFFKTEFIFDSAPYTDNASPYVNGRKYGIQYIDKWLIKYKGELGGFESMQNGAVTGSVSSTDIKNNNFIGSGVQTGKVLNIGNKDGNYLSIYGECPNKTVGSKCKTKPCYNNINNQDDDCAPKIERQINLVDSLDALKNNTSNISALYFGTVRLDDLNGSNQGTSCYNGLSKIYSMPKGSFNSDKDIPIWKNLIDPNTDISKSDAYKLLNNKSVWGCKMGQDKTYTWNSIPDLSGININNICNGKFTNTEHTCVIQPPSPPSPPCPSGVKCDPTIVPKQECASNGKQCPDDGCCPK